MSYNIKKGLFEFVLALIIVGGVVYMNIMGIDVNSEVYVFFGMISGFFFGKTGKTNGAYEAGRERGYKSAIDKYSLDVKPESLTDNIEEIEVKYYG